MSGLERVKELRRDDAQGRASGRRRRWIASVLLLATLLVTGGALATWKMDSIRDQDAAAAMQPEPMEAVTAALATSREHRQTITSIGTVLATRSVTLRNELPGTVQEVTLPPGRIVEAGTVLVRLDVSVEQAEMEAHRAEVTLAQALLDRSRPGRARRSARAHREHRRDHRPQDDPGPVPRARRPRRRPPRAVPRHRDAPDDAPGHRRRRARGLRRPAARRRGPPDGR
jgi:multidrug resistance efflux pump